MLRHLLANLWLLALTLILCSLAYPLALLGIARLPFLKAQAEGSLLVAGDKVVGSRLEAKAFDSDEYFWPRPSAASYNGQKSAASNLSANNPALRSQVENRLGSVLKYGPKSPKKGEMIRGDIETWFVSQRGLLAKWAEKNPDLAGGWVKDNKLVGDFIKAETHRKLDKHIQLWLPKSDKKDAKIADLKPEDLAVPFMTWVSEVYPGTWPTVEEIDLAGAETKPLELKLVKTGTDIQNFFYPLWREAHPDVDLDPVPADMVTTSGSGLDPHITLKSALYQFDRVAGAWAEKRGVTREQTARRLRKLLDGHTHAPLAGLAGVEMVNIMDLNFALANSDW